MWNNKDDASFLSVHPNPVWARRAWISLDGDWLLAHDGKTESVVVPFPVGSEASGVDFSDSGTFVYTKTFEFADLLDGDRLYLNVGAADYKSEVFVNGTKIGNHVGGYTSFHFDISEALKLGENILKIIVRDSCRPGQVRGKQTFLSKPFFVWYAGFAGLWQSVWLERMGPVRIASARVDADWARKLFTVSVNVDGGHSRTRLFFEIDAPDGSHMEREADSSDGKNFSNAIPFGEIGEFPWAPETPNLYRITYRLNSDDRVMDVIDSYFGLRRIETRDRDILLNGKPVFLRMALVQGYYPRGGYTPLTDEAIIDDITTLKKMGFNGARIHQKIESPRFHYFCDKLGLLTTFEMPSFYLPSRKAFLAYESELREVIERDWMHPSSIAWILFNETWGIWGIYRRGSPTRRFVEKMITLVREKDSGRPVIENSGWEHFDTDIVDFHHYLGTSDLAVSTYQRMKARDPSVMNKFSIRDVIAFYLCNGVATKTKTLFLNAAATNAAEKKKSPWFLSEYGGFGWYKISEKGSAEDKIKRYTEDIVDSGLFCGYCLTQLYDVGNETNGLLTANRKPKVNISAMREINSREPR